MIGVYLFNFDTGDNWKNKSNQLYIDRTEFVSKNEIYLHIKEKNVDPRGFIIMPSTYAPNITGPFSIMIKCKIPYTFKEFSSSTL